LATEAGYAPSKIKRLRNEEGTERKVEVVKRVKHWWSESGSGALTLTIRNGSKPIGLAKVKNVIELVSEGGVVPILKSILAAVDAGELDLLLEAQAAFGRLVLKTK
jgi:hypothetical protein